MWLMFEGNVTPHTMKNLHLKPVNNCTIMGQSKVEE
jgi:hypothetical protein